MCPLFVFARGSMLKQKTLVSLFAVLVFLSTAGLNAYAQCGLFFKRTSTWAFPVSRIHLNAGVDMTGDGLPDLIASEERFGSWTREQVFIIPNLGNGTFGPPSTTLLPEPGQVFNYRFNPVRANNDNLMDLFMMLGDSGGGSTAFRIYINNGDGTFTPGPTNTMEPSSGPFLTDINNDGNGDYLSQNSAGTEFRYHPGN